MKKYKVTFTKEYEYSEEYLKIIFTNNKNSFEEQALEIASWDLDKDLNYPKIDGNFFNSKVEVYES